MKINILTLKSDENKHFNPENTNFIKICNYYDKRIKFTEVFGIEHHRSEYAIMEQFGEDFHRQITFGLLWHNFWIVSKSIGVTLWFLGTNFMVAGNILYINLTLLWIDFAFIWTQIEVTWPICFGKFCIVTLMYFVSSIYFSLLFLNTFLGYRCSFWVLLYLLFFWKFINIFKICKHN